MKYFNSRAILLFGLMLICSVSQSQNKVAKYKFDTANRVFNKLKAAKGIYEHERPFLLVEKVMRGGGNLSIAYINYSTSEIHLEEQIYDICSEDLGADSLSCLSFILGHELAHFLNHDTDISHHASSVTNSIMEDSTFISLISEKVDNLNEDLLATINTSITQYKNKQGEAFADLNGGFLTYLAGFKSSRKSPSVTDIFFDSTYAKLDLSSKNPEYPTLFERKTIASSAHRVLDSLIAVYEMGNYFVAIEQFDDAMAYYEKIASSFKSREIFNNMGVVALLAATKCFDPNDVPPNLPITLDLETKMDGGKAVGVGCTEEERNEKLFKAIRYFEKSIYYDDQYPIAYLNLSIAQTLLSISYKKSITVLTSDALRKEKSDEQLILARAAIIKAKDISINQTSARKKYDLEGTGRRNQETDDKQVLSNIYIQSALISKFQDKTSEAELYTEKAKSLNPENIFLESERIFRSFVSVDSILCKDEEESMGLDDGIDDNWTTFATSDSLDNKWQTNDTILEAQFKYFKGIQTLRTYKDENFDAFSNYSHLTMSSTTETLIIVPKKVKQTKCGISKGDSRITLEKLYDKPTNVVPINNGSYFVYEKLNPDKKDTNGLIFQRGIVFQLDATSVVQGWFLYGRLTKPFKL